MKLFNWLRSRNESPRPAGRPTLGARLELEPLEHRAMQSTLTPTQMRQNVLGIAEFADYLSTYARTHHQALSSAITATGQVNVTSSTGAVVDSNGSCYDFVQEVLLSAGAHGSYNSGSNVDYVWGTLVEHFGVASSNKNVAAGIPLSYCAAIQPGDVLQFRDVYIAGGSFQATQHSAIVVSNSLATGQVTLLEQNFNNQHFVTEDTISLSKISEGQVWVYQPNPA